MGKMTQKPIQFVRNHPKSVQRVARIPKSNWVGPTEKGFGATLSHRVPLLNDLMQRRHPRRHRRPGAYTRPLSSST